MYVCLSVRMFSDHLVSCDESIYITDLYLIVLSKYVIYFLLILMHIIQVELIINQFIRSKSVQGAHMHTRIIQ